MWEPILSERASKENIKRINVGEQGRATSLLSKTLPIFAHFKKPTVWDGLPYYLRLTTLISMLTIEFALLNCWLNIMKHCESATDSLIYQFARNMFFWFTEIIQRVTIHENPPFRPKLGNIGKECEVPGLIQMTEKCWNEQPEARPEFEDLKRQIRKMSVGRYIQPQPVS